MINGQTDYSWQGDRFVLAFDAFDYAWEYVQFVARLSRSSDYYPKIICHGTRVEIEVDNEPKNYRSKLESFFKEGNVDINQKEVSLFADGGARGNPGPAASGYVILDKEGQEISSGGEYLGISTNNQAEYHSLILGLQDAIRLKIGRVDIFMDSLLVVNQIKGVYKVKNRDLWPLYESAQRLLNGLEYQISHVPRELNKAADAMVNQVLDEKVGPRS